MVPDLKLSQWSDDSKYVSLVVPSIGADITGSINIELSESGWQFNMIG